jgi:hypothetical protein
VEEGEGGKEEEVKRVEVVGIQKKKMDRRQENREERGR